MTTLQEQAQTAAKLAASAALRDLQRKRQAAAQQYNWGKSEITPEYDRFVTEQNYNLGQILAQGEAARGQASQEYGISARNLGESLRQQQRQSETDMARRGLWQSGLALKASTGLQGKYLTSMGDIGLSNYNRMADIGRTGQLAQQKATFNISDAQRARVAKLQKMLEAYQGEVTAMDWQQQGLAEDEGLRASDLYQKLLQQQFQNQMAQEQQGLAVQQFHHSAYWEQQKFDEDKRRFGLNYAIQAAQLRQQGINV